MSRGRARRDRQGIAAGVLLLSAGLVATSGATPSNDDAAPAVAAPLAASSATASATWAAVPMGFLDQPDNTFWQLFVAYASANRFSLVTPPGVADNGGLVGASAAGDSFVAGFEASQLLEFSPLARTADGGRSWSALADPLPHPLAPEPSAIATSSDGEMLALEDARGGTAVLASSGSQGWRSLASSGSLGSSAATRSCRPRRLTAVAFAASGKLAGNGAGTLQAWIGADCDEPGKVGLLERQGSNWRLAGPQLPAGDRRVTASVLRLGSGTFGLVALVALAPPPGSREGREGTVLLGALQRSGTAGWQLSAPLRLPIGASLTSTSVSAAGALIVTYRPGSSERAALEPTAAGAWSLLPTLPPQTAVVTETPGGHVDAIAVHHSEMTAYTLSGSPRSGRSPASGSWSAIEHLNVPIQYGSSS